MTISAVLIDNRNFDTIISGVLEKVKNSKYFGFDIETHDQDAHQGIKDFRGSKTAQAFDVNRMTVTGFSFYCDGDDTAYYVNLNHADIENRVTWEKARVILDSVPETALKICHNGPFEITMMRKSLGFELENVICTLQMAVSAYGADEYAQNKYLDAQLGDIKNLFKDASKLFRTWEPGSNMSPEQHELLTKVISKQSTASYSYNGFVKSVSYGYGLKKAVKSWFDYDMTTYEEALNGKDHMGQLTGEEVLEYGADDAYWAVRLFHRLLQYMVTNCPNAIDTFFEQENPMIYMFADTWSNGLKVNKKGIEARKKVERAEFAQALREMKDACRRLLPFPVAPNEDLMKYEPRWYAKKPQEYRQKLIDWINTPDHVDDYTQCNQISCAVSNSWAFERGVKPTVKKKDLSLMHYYQTRVIMFDLMKMKAYVSKGSIQSDGEARGWMLERIEKYKKEEGHDPLWLKACEDLIKVMNKLASIDQRVKLYITPYLNLTDPDTGRMYPTISSQLVTRRMAMSNPNGMQLAKRGESTYVRGFYEPDEKDHVLVSLDWSQIELVLIGEFSGDPEFAKAYGQLPYQDLHLGAAADVLSIAIPGVTEELLNDLNSPKYKDVTSFEKAEELGLPPKLLTKPNGDFLSPDKAKKFWRNNAGKISNFNYWYSGALSTTGTTLGWTSDQLWSATDKYRERFKVAEAWRVGVIDFARFNGFVELPDGHKRVKWEATYEWKNLVTQLFKMSGDVGIERFGNEIIRDIHRRAGNQMVNAMIQGSCATLAKRSIIRISKKIQEMGLRARVIMPIHDELVASVHKDDVIKYIRMAKEVMANHPDIIKKLKVHSTASIGLTFEPYDADKAPYGQVELDEIPKNFLGMQADGVMTEDEIQKTIDHLFEVRDAA